LNSVFAFEGIEVVEKVQKISHLAMKLPLLMPFLSFWFGSGSQNCSSVFFVISSMWRYKTEKPISWWEVMKVFWRYRKNYLRYVS